MFTAHQLDQVKVNNAREFTVTTKGDAAALCPHCKQDVGYRKVVACWTAETGFAMLHAKDCFAAFVSARLETVRRLEKEAEEALRAKRDEERAARVAARGSFEAVAERSMKDKADLDEGEQRLSFWARQALATIKAHEAVTAKLAERFASNPVDALSWGRDYFEHAANYHVAKWVERMTTEVGLSADEIKAEATKHALRGARSPGRSSSSTSNLMDEYLTEAWAKFAEGGWW